MDAHFRLYGDFATFHKGVRFHQPEKHIFLIVVIQMSINGLKIFRNVVVHRFSPLLPKKIFLSSLNSLALMQKRSIVHKNSLKLDEETYPEPWPYKEKGFSFFHAIFDRTQPRFHQNSKLIVVEGNIGSGKTHTAKEIADQLGFYFMPEFKMEHILIDRYGNDLRNFYHLIPQSYRVPDMEMFYKNPGSNMTAVMCNKIFQCRFEQYLNALAHILNTGQGVVLERSPFSDFIFINALRSKNYIGPEYFKHYYYVRKNALAKLFFWPHLVIYLDAPIETCLQNIRNEGNIDKAAVADASFISIIADSYKDCIKEFRPHSKILVYDWTMPGDTDRIIEDIENIDFDFFEWHSGDVFEEWFTTIGEIAWGGWRIYVTSKFEAYMRAFGGIPTHEVNELYVNPRDTGHFLNVIQKEVLKSPYTYGYNPKYGDSIFAGFMVGGGKVLLPEPWYEYYQKEAYIDHKHSLERTADPYSENYNPDYLKAHH